MSEDLHYFILHTSMLFCSSQNFMKDQQLQLIKQFYIVFFYVFFLFI
jgi:hypothetical protein